MNEKDPTVTEKAVNHFLENDISVEKATKAFSANGQTYPAGTYIVDMSQAKAGLANTMLWDGEDITNDTPAMYDISAWSLPELWGFEAIEVKEELKAKTAPVKEADYAGSINGKGPYVISNSSVQAVKLVNDLVKAGESVYKGNDEHFYVETLSASNKTLVKKSGISLETAKMPAQKKTIIT